MSGDIFKSAEHRSRFMQIMKQLNKSGGGRFDSEYAAALYILTADAGTWKRASGYVSQSGIRFSTMLNKGYLSSGEAVLVKLAANLFGQNKKVDPVEFMVLDENNFKLALNALQVRRYSLGEESKPNG
jgi:hypothetical protein